MRSLAAGRRDAPVTAFLWITSVAHMAQRVLEKNHMGIISTSFRNTFGSLQLCRVFHWGCAQQNSSTDCHQLSEGCWRGEKVQFTLTQPGSTADFFLAGGRDILFPFQPSESDSQSHVRSKGLYLVAIFCRMTLCKTCFIPFFGR